LARWTAHLLKLMFTHHQPLDRQIMHLAPLDHLPADTFE
jgi:hypothetical protein